MKNEKEPGVAEAVAASAVRESKCERLEVFLTDANNQKIAAGTLLFGVGLGLVSGSLPHLFESPLRFFLYALGVVTTFGGATTLYEGGMGKDTESSDHD